METQQTDGVSAAALEAVSNAGIDPAPSAPAPEPTAAPATPDVPVTKTAESPFTPDFKYVFQGQEKQLEDFWKPLVKDTESQKRVIDYIQRAEATEYHKTQSKSYQDKISEYEPTIQTVAELEKLWESKDYESVLEKIGMTDDLLFEVARQKLERQKLPEDQRKVYEQNRTQRLENQKLVEENQKYQQAQMKEFVGRVEYQLDTELGKAEHQPLVSTYEKSNGSGSFRQMVIRRGSEECRARGVIDIPPAEIVGLVTKEFAPFLQAQAAQSVANREKPKVIPNVGSGTGSPGKASYKSISDLKALHKQMTERE